MERFGYKRVTIDDVASHADIGKGTVYQHWKTRQALFTAVLAREFVAAVEELLAIISQDPQAVLLHRLTSSFYLIVMRRPLLRAVYTADLEMLGKLGKSDMSRAVNAQENVVIRDYLLLLAEYGLIPAGISSDELLYTFFAVMTGFFLFEPIKNHCFQIELERKADLLSATVQRAFETNSAPPPSIVQAIADRTIVLFVEYAHIYRAQLRRAYE